MKITLSFKEASEILAKCLAEQGRLTSDCSKISVYWSPGDSVSESYVEFKEK